MGLFQQAVKTYDFLESIHKVGIYTAEEREPLAPIGHTVAGADIEITVDKNGGFIGAKKLGEKNNGKKIIIPVTMSSLGRSGTKSPPHPLCDKLSYMVSRNENKYSNYIELLKQWADSEKYTDERVQAVLKYIENGTIEKDLVDTGIIKADKIGKDDSFICWSVLGIEESGSVYVGSLLKKYEQFFLETNDHADSDICFVTGEKEAKVSKHPGVKGMLRIISFKDDGNFVHTGRFCNNDQALAVSLVASQKAHNVIKWLIANGSVGAERSFVCWNPNGKKVSQPALPFLNGSKEKYIWENYKSELKNLLEKRKTELGETEDVLIAAFDSATPGRMAVTYYNELKASDYLERLEYWDETCCWYDNRWGTKSPDLYNIIKYAFGYQRGNDDNSKVEVDADIVGQHMQRLINCRVDKDRIPPDIKNNLVNKAERLQLYNKKNKDSLLFTACAVIRKYKIDYEKEEYQMALETEKKDRSYQYGRLLAVLEKIEKDTYDSEKDRTTNALRMQSVFVKRPAYAARIITEQLKNAYYPKLSPAARTYYGKLIGQIMEIISEFGDEEFNKPLTETYLLGYYLQQNALYKKNNNDEEREEN